MEPRPTRLLVRSDSQGTSLGEGTVDPHDERLWPALVARLLVDRGQPVQVRNASSAGLTIAHALNGFRTDQLVRQPMLAADVVILGLGINDWWPLARPRQIADWMDRARPLLLRRALRRLYQKLRPRLLVWTRGGFRPTPPGEAKRHLIELVQGLTAAGRGVLLVTPFPVRSPKNPHLDGNTWEACDTVVEVGAATDVPVVDCRTLFQPIAWETISIDHIHVNEEGQRVIAAAVADALITHELLGARDRPDAGFDPPSPAAVLWRAGGGAPPGMTDGGGPVDIHNELRQVQHDPLVREAYQSASGVAVGLASTRLSAWDRERLRNLVAVVTRTSRLVLVAPVGGQGQIEMAVEDCPNQEQPVAVVADAQAAMDELAEPGSTLR